MRDEEISSHRNQLFIEELRTRLDFMPEVEVALREIPSAYHTVFGERLTPYSTGCHTPEQSGQMMARHVKKTYAKACANGLPFLEEQNTLAFERYRRGPMSQREHDEFAILPGAWLGDPTSWWTAAQGNTKVFRRVH